MSRIKDIADDAQVSIATVSRVLNGSQPVSDELRARVMDSVARLGYQPNLVARSLRTRRTFLLGVIIPNISNPYFTDMARAVEDVALQAGYMVTLCSSDQDLAKEQRYLQVLKNRMVDGVIIAVADAASSDLAPLIENDVPVVLVDRRLGGVSVDTVTVDTRGGASGGVEHLIGRGYRRIAFLGGPASVSTATDKLAGYQDALRDHGLPVDDDLIFPGAYTEASGLELGRRILSMPQPPQAVLVANNLMTLGFYRAVRERGLAVPREIAFIGFDDSQWASLVDPPLTMIDQPTYDLGRIAAEMLLERMDGEHEGEARHQVLPTRLIIRGSC